MTVIENLERGIGQDVQPGQAQALAVLGIHLRHVVAVVQLLARDDRVQVFTGDQELRFIGF